MYKNNIQLIEDVEKGQIATDRFVDGTQIKHRQANETASSQFENIVIDGDNNTTTTTTTQSIPTTTLSDREILVDGNINTTITTAPTIPPVTSNSNSVTPTTTTFTSKAKTALTKNSTVFCGVAILTVCVVICVLVIVSLLWHFKGWRYGMNALIVALIVIAAASGLWLWLGNWLYIALVTGPRDLRALLRYFRLRWFVGQFEKRDASIGEMFEETVAKHPDKVCFIYEGTPWTFRELNELSNKIGHLFLSRGYKLGDTIGLYMENRPEYVATWMGLSKIGVIIPLINSNLRYATLVHSITIAKCTALVYSEALCNSVNDIADELKSTVTFFQYNDAPNRPIRDNSKDVTTLLMASSSDNLSQRVDKNRHHSKLLYIYTSGTTGLPKAAVITHSRFLFITAAIHYMGRFRLDDIFYNPLPLYHTAGGVMNVGQALIFGNTVVLKKKFSASNYFPDCQKYNCTIAQYIGEMARYILATKPSPADRAHKVRTIFGNGLRPQIWPQFIERFNIKHVAEFYGATEGNANIVNVDNTVGAIGFISRIIPSLYPISIIKADPFTGEPIRGTDGLCQLCEPHEPGVFIGKILRNDPTRQFLGYVDQKASNKKIVRDVFRKGDSAFISGDLLVADDYGNLFFKDRTGDTFRWKGENVSTSEVEAQVSNVAGYRDTVVYGVEIPHLEGRAGMAAILDVNREVDLTSVANGLQALLPSYARPQFIRLLTKVDMTGTFKLKKLDLQKEGFDPNIISDDIYYMTPQGTYELLTPEKYVKITNGEIRF